MDDDEDHFNITANDVSAHDGHEDDQGPTFIPPELVEIHPKQARSNKKPTTPTAYKFQSDARAASKSKPLSSEDLELQYIKDHATSFKATPVPDYQAAH